MDYYMRDGSLAPGADHREQMMAWAKAYEHDDRHVDATQLGRFWVSTVFMGLDHSWGEGPPLIFETMVFAETDEDRTDVMCQRYGTEAEAQAGHDAVVQRIIDGTFTDYCDEVIDTTYEIQEVPTLI